MSGVAKKVGLIAGVAAFAASVALTAGATAVAGASLTTVLGIAGTVATVANVGADLLAKKPPAQGSVTQTTIGTDQPSPYIVGRTYYAGAREWLTGYGATLNKVKNPYLLAVDVHSVGGPLEALESVTADRAAMTFSGAIGNAAATGYFGGFLWWQAQLGAQPETAALAPHYSGAPGWSASSGLSGKAAIAWSALFDKDGNVFASGFPPMGAVWRGVKCYDPRLDSTYPGGSGAHRWASPADTAAHDAARATWTYTTNPGLHALRYALGTWERDSRISGSKYRRTFGAGIPIDGLVVAHFVTLANVCAANGWTAGGVLMEPTSSKWDNLKRILAAGGAEPAWTGGRLGVRVQAPRVALDTITAKDLAEGEIVIGAMAGWEQRLNTLIPKYRSEAHRWEYVATTAPVQIASYLAEDGEEKVEERQIDLVQDPTQAAQLCSYELFDRRELGEIELTGKPRLRRYGPGDLLIVNLPEAGLVNQPAVVLTRSLDPATMSVRLTLRGETTAKHAAALGLTGTAPATPTLTGTAVIDGAAAVTLALISESRAAADAAQAAADAAGVNAVASLMLIARIQSDGYLTAGEKPDIIRQWNDITAERLGIYNQAGTVGLSTASGTVADNFAVAYGALNTYLGSLTPAYSDTSADTLITAATFNAKFSDYYYARTTLLNAIAARAAQIALWDNVTGSGKDALIAQAADAQAKANSAQSVLSIIAADNYLSANEKPDVIREFQVIAAEQSVIYGKASALGLSTAGGSLADQFAVAYSALNTYLAGLSPAYTSTTTDTAITATTFRGKFADYYAARTALLNAMTEKAGTTATWPGVSNPAGTKPADNAGTSLALYNAKTAAPIAITGNTLVKTADNNQWSGNVYSRDVYKGASYCAGQVTSGQAFLGLTATRAYAGGTAENLSCDYYVALASGTLYAVYGPTQVLIGSTSGTYGDWLEVRYDETALRFLKNGVEFASTAQAPGKSFYAAAGLYGIGDTIANLQYDAGSVKVAPTTAPPIMAANLGYSFGGAISYAAAAGAGTATISIGAGALTLGSNVANYNPMGVSVAGTPGTPVIFQLYAQETGAFSTWGGSKTPIATTVGANVYADDRNVWLGSIPVTFPASGAPAGSGGGSSGGGGGGRGGAGNPIP